MPSAGGGGGGGVSLGVGLSTVGGSGASAAAFLALSSARQAAMVRSASGLASPLLRFKYSSRNGVACSHWPAAAWVSPSHRYGPGRSGASVRAALNTVIAEA